MLTYLWGLELVDFDIPKCTPSHAWVNGDTCIGSLLRRADLSHNRIERIQDLSSSHQFLQELNLAHNEIAVIEGVSHLRFLRVLDLSHNKLTSTRGLVDLENKRPYDSSEARDAVDNQVKSLEALEKLVLSYNCIEAVEEVAFLPRLETLDLAHNSMKQLYSIGVCGALSSPWCTNDRSDARSN